MHCAINCKFVQCSGESSAVDGRQPSSTLSSRLLTSGSGVYTSFHSGNFTDGGSVAPSIETDIGIRPPLP